MSFRNSALIFLLLFLVLTASAQGNRKIQYRADIGLYDEEELPGAQKLIGNVAFAQDNIKGYCDSAYLYESDNYLIAFGNNIRILIGDSVRLYGRRAYYDGNSKTAAIAVGVKMEKSAACLLTDSLIYDLNEDCAYYLTGGRLYNEKDTLTSKQGRYYTKTEDAFAYKNVFLRSDSYRMNCEALQYNTSSKTAFFISPTHLVATEDTSEIFTDRGWFDTERNLSVLAGNVKLLNKEKRLFADSVYYDKELKFGHAWNNVTTVDTIQQYILKGNYFEYHDNGAVSFVTDSALLVLIDEHADSLFLHADTLQLLFDEQHETQWMKAFNKVKFYRSDLQGVCDSLVYLTHDSLITMFYNPVVWSSDYQLSADTIQFSILDSNNMKIDLCRAGFIAGSLYENTEFNQIKGTYITGLIKDNNLYQVDILNNAECIYYLQEEDSSLIGINSSVTSEMRILLKNSKINQIRFYDQPDGTIYPDSKFEEKERRLQNFRWLDEYRPYAVPDLFCKPIPRNR